MSAYYTLLVSLPHHDNFFKVKETPISRIQLEKRMKMLTEDDLALVKELEFLLWQSWFSPDLSLDAVVFRAKKLLATQKESFIKEIMNWHFDLRSLLTALRLRQSKPKPPSNPNDYWFSNLTVRLINHWSEPDFGLKYIYPWLIVANQKVLNGETAALEDIILTEVWKYLAVVEDRHYFDLPAFIIYLLRWHIVNYWSSFNEERAVSRVNKMIEEMFKLKEI